MARRLFFVSEIRRGGAELVDEDARHLVQVLRVEVGQVFEISDNHSAFLARVTTARKSLVEFEVMEQLTPDPDPVKVSLLAALIKFDRFEDMIEKATELGVNEITPFDADRTEHGLNKAALKRSSRWERIGLEASQQSRRRHLPEIRETSRFDRVLGAQADVKLLLDELPETSAILRVLPAQVAASVALLVGPEGGWTDSERAQALAAGWQGCSLGKTVLRAETAAVAALAVVRAWAGAA